MISECSDLYRAHPDWVLRAPFRPTQIGRNQYVLDLSRHDVFDYIFESLSALLDYCNIVYMKCDIALLNSFQIWGTAYYLFKT